jgi:DNA-binding IclR family transcriptional regulator
MTQSTVKSAERTMEVLSFLSSQFGPVPAATISRHVSLPKSSTYHLLNVMLARGFVAYYPEERAWSLGGVARDIGSGHARIRSLERLGRPPLQRLAATTGDTALLCVLLGTDALVVGRADATDRPPAAAPTIGDRLPGHLSAFGRALLMDDAGQVRSLFPAVRELPTLTGKGPRRRSELIELLEQSRAAGYSTDQGETRHAAANTAAPVFDHLGYTTAAIGVTSWSRSRIGAAQHALALEVRRVADELSTRLGFRERSQAS